MPVLTMSSTVPVNVYPPAEAIGSVGDRRRAVGLHRRDGPAGTRRFALRVHTRRSQMASVAVGTEDHALTRVPLSERYSWWQVAVQRFGQISALSDAGPNTGGMGAY